MAKIVKPLSPLQVKNAKHRGKPYKLFDGGGLYLLVKRLQVSDEGMATSRLWRMNYRFGGVGKTLAFGKYPDVSLEQARQRREEARKLIANGVDPSERKKAQKSEREGQAEADANTFEKVAREWHQNRLSGWRPQTAKDYINRLEKDVFPEIGNLPITGITRKQLIAVMRQIEDRGAVEIAKRLLNTCERVFRYAVQNEMVPYSIASDMKGILKPAAKGHFASISPDELPAFLKALDRNTARLHLPTRVALELMLLVFLRTSELIETPWSEINLETGEWVIPWRRMKRGKLAINPDKTDHHVFLPRQALELLQELHRLTGGSKWVFPNQREPSKPMSNGAILMALRRMGYQNKMTGHGFRALAMSTIKERLGYRHEVVDRQLAHAQKNQVDAAYDRALFLQERKKMLQDWADYLDALRTGKVLPFNRRSQK
ncbi:MAG: integrase arm-type DNA-binding domain-containing protein [Burkholderiaceae bacterium]|jgi:integrase|nr:integrase arm-type DNA-binding domain-containing protein [Burkholderiaceae bacterium]